MPLCRVGFFFFFRLGLAVGGSFAVVCPCKAGACSEGVGPKGLFWVSLDGGLASDWMNGPRQFGVRASPVACSRP